MPYSSCTKCSALVPLGESRCLKHRIKRADHELSSKARGYGPAHTRLRSSLVDTVNEGYTKCAKCGQVIIPGSPWDLGHTDDRLGYTGPEHRRCNRGAPHRGGR